MYQLIKYWAYPSMATLNKLEILINKVCCFSSVDGLTHVNKQSIREYYVFKSFYQFDQQNARTCVA